MAKLGMFITLASLVLIAACVAPIWLYSILGPEDGNPIGLGLLMACGTPVFVVTLVVGIVLQVVAATTGKAGIGDPERR